MATPGTNTDPSVFLLPDLGEGLDEAELVEWNVAEGDTVEESQVLAKMETAKALVDVYSPRAGKIASLHGKAGEVVKVGTPLVRFDDGKTSTRVDKPGSARSPERNGTHATQDRETARQGHEVPAQLAAAESHQDSREDSPAADAPRRDAGTVVGQISDIGGVSGDGKVLAAPAVRRLARDFGVDLTGVKGSGIGGRVTSSDVRQAAGGKAAPARQRQAPLERVPEPHERDYREEAEILRRLDGPDADDGPDAPPTRIPFRGVRRTIANHLRHSVDKAVHFGVMDEADVTGLDALRKRLVAAGGEKMSLLPFVCVAAARILAGEFGYPLARLNATVDDEAGEILQHPRVNLGIAVDTSGGLMVPVIRSADRLGVIALSRRINEVAKAARDRSVTAADLRGGTFTVSNFGSYAGRFATPILNYPEVAILAVGRMREGVVVKGGMMGVGKLLPLSLVCDHRVIDGATGTMFLAELVRLLGSPDELLPQK